MAFECGICTSIFNGAQRQPLILECGHSFCRHCIQHNLGPQRWCPYCRQPISKHADDLPRNYALENAMEAANVPLMELMDRWGLANAERMMVKPDQLQLVNLISRKGNTGEVWRGLLWGKAVAIKLLPLVGVDDRQLDCLRREVAVLLHTTGECKQVCIYKGFCVKGGNFAIIMKLYSYSLAARVARHPGRRLPLPLALKYSVDIAKGLVELHRLGVTAADLKPDNVLIDDELGDAVIADFGISSVVTCSIGVVAAAAAAGRHRRGTSNGLRSSGVMRGTPNYMAPEQFTPGHKPTNKVDIWGFAATLLHMVTGAPPWQHDTLLQICTAVGVSKQSPPLPEGLPPQMQALLQSCFEADPARRPTAAHLLKALQTMGSALERPQLLRATSSLQRNSQLLAAARGVLLGLQQDCCQLVQQLNEEEGQAPAEAATAWRQGHLEAVEEGQEGQQQQQQQKPESSRSLKGQKQAVQSSESNDKQADLDQYLAQLGLLSLLSRESSLGMPSAPPLPGGSSSSGGGSSSRPSSSHSSGGGLGLNPRASGTSSSGGSSSCNKLPRVLWSEEEALKEEQEFQQQRRQQQQMQQQGVAAGMGLAQPRKVQHTRSASEQVGGLSTSHSAVGQLQWAGTDQQSRTGLRDVQQQQHHNRSMSEVCQIWGAREFDAGAAGGGSRRNNAGPALPTHYESPLRGAEAPGLMERVAGAADVSSCCLVAEGDCAAADVVAAGSSPSRQRKQWQIPASTQQQFADRQQQQQPVIHGLSKWPGRMEAEKQTAGGPENPNHQQQQQQELHSASSSKDPCCSASTTAAAPAAGPLTAAVAAHRAQHSLSSCSPLRAHTVTTSDSTPAADAGGLVSAGLLGSSSSSSCTNSRAAAVPSSPRRHTRTLSNLLLGRGSSPSPGPACGASLSSSSPERSRRSGGVAAAAGASILAGAALCAGAAAGTAVVAAAATGAGLAAAATGSAAAVGGSTLVGAAGTGAAAGAAAAAAAAAVGVSRGAVEAGRVVSPGVVALLAARFGGSSSNSSNTNQQICVEPTSPGKASKVGRWRSLFGGSPAKKRPTTPQQKLSAPAASTASAATGCSSMDTSNSCSSSRGAGSSCSSKTPGMCSSSVTSGLHSNLQQQTPARCSSASPHPGSNQPAALGASDGAIDASAGFHPVLGQQQQQQCMSAGDGSCIVQATAAAVNKSPLRGQEHCSSGLSSLSPSRATARDNVAAAGSSCSGENEGNAQAAAAAPTAAHQSPQGACSPLRSHVRHLSLPSKGAGLGTAGCSADQQRAAAAAAGSPSPRRQQQQQQQCQVKGAQAGSGQPPAAQPSAAAAGSSQTHSQMLAEANSLEGLARQLSASGRKEEAEEALRSALAILHQHLGSSHPNSVTASTRLALHLHRNGKAGDAEVLFRQVLNHKQAMLGKRHPQVATACANLAACLYSQGKYPAAAKVYGSALEIRKSALGEQHADTAACINNLALCNSRLGQHLEAEALYHQALNIRTAALGQSHPDVAATAHSLGHCLNQLSRHSEALVYHKQGLWVRQQRASSTPSRQQGAAASAAVEAGGSSDAVDESVAGSAAAVGRVRQSAGGTSEDVIASHRNVALCLSKLGCDSQAEEHLGQVLEARTGDVLALAVPPPPGVDHPPGVAVCSSTGTAGRHSRQASFAAAAALGLSPANGLTDDVDWSFLADGDTRLSKQQQDALLGMGTAAEELARCYSRQGKHGSAEELYWQALEARSQVLGSRHELVQATEEQLRDCLDRQC